MITQEDLLNNNTLIANVLNRVKEDKMVNNVFLINSIRLEASLIDYSDDYFLISGYNDSLTLVYLHAVSSLSQTDKEASIPSFRRSKESLETDFFKACEELPFINAYLINGVKLKGKVIAFDKNSLLMENEFNGKTSSQVIMKSAIASISTS